jgi:tetratricopeptide (TPR) repeat protein
MLAVSLALGYFLWSEEPQVPDPDRSAMEPQVAAKIAEARGAVLAAPESHEAWGRYGMVLHAHRLEPDAATCYRRASELSPREFRWQYLLAHALRNADVDAALAAAESASRLKPDYASTYVLLAQLLEAGNRQEEALSLYTRAVEADPENAMAEFGLGRLLAAKGDSEAALTHLLRARDLSPDAPAIRGALAQAYRQTGDREAALRENRLASQLTDPIVITDPAHYAMRKESVSSVALLERAIEADRAGEFATAESLFRDLVAIRPDDANIRARFGDTLARQSKIQPAKEQYEKALATQSEMASAHYGLGNMLNFEGDYEGAARHYRAALSTRPDHVSTLVNLSSILAFRGELKEAEDLARQAIQIEPKGYASNLALGRVLAQRKEFREAVSFLNVAVEAREGSGPAHLQLAMALAATGDYASSWKHVERAQELGEKVPPNLVEELRRRVEGPGRRKSG